MKSSDIYHTFARHYNLRFVYRKVASSRPVYYSIFDHFWSATNHGLLNRWTSQYDWGITTGGLTFNLNNGTKTHLIIVKILENTFLGMTKVRTWPILSLGMP